MTRLILSSLAIGLAAVAFSAAGAFAPAAAATKVKHAAKPASKAASKPAAKEASKPSLVATFGDWNVFVGQVGKGRICYALAQPKSREPASLTRDPGYAFISDRPAEGVRNEVSFIMGFDISPGPGTASKSEAKPASKSRHKAKTSAGLAPVALVDDSASFEMLPKGGDLWVKNAAKEDALIAEMRKGSKLAIKAASLRGNQSIDTYSLAGFSQAMERLQKECPLK